MKNPRSPWALGGLAVLALSAAPPMFLQPSAVPAKRIIANLEKKIARIEERLPKQRILLANDLATLYYKLARTHYLALVNQSSLVPAYGDEPAADHVAGGFLHSMRYEEASARAKKALGIDGDATMTKEQWDKLEEARKKEIKRLVASGWRPDPPSGKELHAHAASAMTSFGRAIELASGAEEGSGARNALALYHLGRASLAEQVLELERKDVLPKRAMTKELAAWSDEKVRDEYFRTFGLSIERELDSASAPIHGLTGFVSYEAGRGFLRVTGKSKDLSDGQKERIENVKASLRKLAKLPPGPITPILLGRSAGDELADRVDPDATVVFDLDGDGVAERWPWVARDTPILVWDPGCRAEITSGRQLFGSVTFFLFHRDGYEALALLDDDLDGRLTDLELDGIAVWTDRNGDGESTEDEVRPAHRAGITAIATGARMHGGVPANRRGAVYGDGRVVPTFDWITQRRRHRLHAAPRQ